VVVVEALVIMPTELLTVAVRAAQVVEAQETRVKVTVIRERLTLAAVAAVLQHIPLVEEWAEMVALALLFFA
jgi:hypothetical protein